MLIALVLNLFPFLLFNSLNREEVIVLLRKTGLRSVKTAFQKLTREEKKFEEELFQINATLELLASRPSFGFAFSDYFSQLERGDYPWVRSYGTIGMLFLLQSLQSWGFVTVKVDGQDTRVCITHEGLLELSRQAKGMTPAR